MEYILLIMNCEKYKIKAELQKGSWLKKLPPYITYFHVLAKDCDDYEIDYVNHILYVNTKDDYNSLPHKVIHAYKTILRICPNLKYIFKTDDDQMLTNPRFFDMVKQYIERSNYTLDYGGHKLSIQPYISKYHLVHPELPSNLLMKETTYCTGRFYFLSRRVLLDLVEEYDNIKKEYFEDYAIGLYMPKYYKDNILHLKTDSFFIDQENCK
jgi:Galactosyltransferase